MDEMKQHEQSQTDELLQALTEFPVMGTSLNPLQEAWELTDSVPSLRDQAGSTD
jgi:hypothetical protein